MRASNEMKPKYRNLILWSLGFFFLFVELKGIFQHGPESFLQTFTVFKSFVLTLSSLLIFNLYALGTYAILYWAAQRKWYQRGLLIYVQVTAVVGFRYVVEEELFPVVFGFGNYFSPIDWKYYYLDNLYYGIVFGAVAVVYYYAQVSTFKERKHQELQQQNQRAELAYLRSQVNPHFLFNTLNNIYSLVYQKSDRALQAMDKLTAVLRYSLYEQQERVSLRKELTHIHDFIELQLLRYDFEAQYELKVQKDLLDCEIPPFSFIAFIENAFKHGDLKNKELPLRIEFSQKGKNLHFLIQNAKVQQKKDKSGGIGLENIQKRLSLIYGEQHSLQIEESETRYEVSLQIPLKLCQSPHPAKAKTT